ncbi:MAG: hypothetical protein R3F41_07975 [Gammaproteobacteria bacterium]|nr:hypothetical protein [Pseudomonadales bacterium]
MKPSSVKIVDRVSAFEAIKRLNEEDLLFLNRLIVERLKLISQARATTLMISVATDDGHQWNVAPGLLRLVQSAGDIQWP